MKQLKEFAKISYPMQLLIQLLPCDMNMVQSETYRIFLQSSYIYTTR